MARRRIVLIDPEVVADVLRADGRLTARRVGERVTSDAPDDLTVVGCGWDETRQQVRIAVESSTFDDIPDGVFAPEWTPLYTRHYDEMTEFEAAMAVLGGHSTAGRTS
jgi:hypothetical protein